jgi:hypothetical protein
MKLEHLRVVSASASRRQVGSLRRAGGSPVAGDFETNNVHVEMSSVLSSKISAFVYIQEEFILQNNNKGKR